MPSSTSSLPPRIVILCVFFSVLMNFYLYNRKSGIEINCIIDAEKLENFTRTQYEQLSSSSRVKKEVHRDQKCENFVKNNRTLQLRLYAFPTAGLAQLDHNQKKANEEACCKFDDPSKFSNISDQNLLLFGNYFQSYKYFHHLRPQIRKWLKPTVFASSLSSMLFPQALRNSFVICPHIRRGDFKTDNVHEPSDASFTRNAIDFLVDYYSKDHKDITIAVLGNDQQFAYILFQDKLGNPSNPISNSYNYTVPSDSPEYKVLISPSFTPELDLAFSRSFCDVTLITAPSSTFGWWLSYLAKPSAETFYRDIRETKDKVANEMNENDFYPPDWMKLGTLKNGSIQIFE